MQRRPVWIVAVITPVILMLACGSGEDSFIDADWGGATSLVSVVENSPVIVAGSVVSESEKTTELRSPATGEVAGKRIERVWAVVVDEALRSEFLAADVTSGRAIEVRATRRMELFGESPRKWDIDTVQIEVGQRYVLFLTRFSDETGDALGLNGAVAAARIDGDELVFLAPQDYRDEIEEIGLYEPGNTGLGQSFDTTVAELRTYVSTVPYRATTDQPDPTEIARISTILAQTNIVETVLSDVDNGALTTSAAIEARFRELGFDPSVLGDCRGAERRFADRGFPVELGCP